MPTKHAQVGDLGAYATHVTLREKGRLTIPQQIRDAAHLAAGQVMEMVVVDAETIQLRPVMTVGRDEAWLLQPAWQERIAEGIADIRAGRVIHHESDDDFLAALE